MQVGPVQCFVERALHAEYRVFAVRLYTKMISFGGQQKLLEYGCFDDTFVVLCLSQLFVSFSLFFLLQQLSFLLSNLV
jgi:hypothetical protein